MQEIIAKNKHFEEDQTLFTTKISPSILQCYDKTCNDLCNCCLVQL